MLGTYIKEQAVAFDNFEHRRAVGVLRRVLGVGHAQPAGRKWSWTVRRLLLVALMIVSILSMEALIPADVIDWTWTCSPGWWLWLPLTTVVIAIIVVVLPWCQFIPYSVRPIVPLAMVAAAGHAGGPVGASVCAALLLAAWVLIRRWLNRGSLRQEAIEISPPFASGVYFVGQGGGSSDVNHHFLNESQRFALDILRLNWLTMRAWGFFPRQLGRYAIYGTQVLCPVAGVVTAVVDGLPDMDPLVQRDADDIAGNHIVIQCAARTDTFVGLAHLLAGSIQVRVGDAVSAGQPLARVGNSGNTTEPHLHIHAKTGGEPDCMLDGQGVPLHIRGRFLMRNDLFRGLTGKGAARSAVSEEARPMSRPETPPAV